MIQFVIIILNGLKISKINSKNSELKNQEIFNFVKQYVRVTKNNDYVCKSCLEYLPIKKYVYEGTFVKELDTFLTTNIAIKEGIKNVAKFKKLKKSIQNINKIIERIAYITNLNHIIGNDPIIKLKREMIIKDVMDLILLHTKHIKQLGKNRINQAVQKYKINKNYTNLFFFDLKIYIFNIIRR